MQNDTGAGRALSVRPSLCRPFVSLSVARLLSVRPRRRCRQRLLLLLTVTRPAGRQQRHSGSETERNGDDDDKLVTIVPVSYTHLTLPTILRV